MATTTQADAALDRLLRALAVIREAQRPHWIMVGSLTGLIAVISVVVALILPRWYKADVQFVAGQSSSLNLPAAILGIAGQLGITAGADANESPQFYVQLLTTRPVLDSLLMLHPVHTCGAAPASNLLQILKPSGDDRLDSLAHARDKLADLIDADADLRTSIVSMSIEAPCAELAAELADSLIASLNAFNVHTRQTNAKQRRVFTEGRVAQAEQELQAAEDELKDFLKRNRQFDASPELHFEYDRLTRRVSMRQDVATSLHTQFESARIEEVNTTPTLTVLQPATVPTRPARPKRRVIVILSTLFGVLVGVGAATLRSLTSESPATASADLQAARGWLRSRLAIWRGRPAAG